MALHSPCAYVTISAVVHPAKVKAIAIAAMVFILLSLMLMIGAAPPGG